MNKLRRKWGTKKFSAIVSIAVLLVVVCTTVVLGADEAEYQPTLFATAWALFPPIIAIALAVSTKEVYSSLLHVS